MERDALRLECLKLAVGKTHDHPEALLRAEAYYEFVEKPVENSKPSTTTPTALKHVGNTKP